jgi:hypothetical protein
MVQALLRRGLRLQLPQGNGRRFQSRSTFVKLGLVRISCLQRTSRIKQPTTTRCKSNNCGLRPEIGICIRKTISLNQLKTKGVLRNNDRIVSVTLLKIKRLRSNL